MAPRRQLSAFLSAESYAAWHAFAARRHVSVSALLEALGHELGRLDREGLLASGPLRKAVEAAGPLSAKRRSRRPK